MVQSNFDAAADKDAFAAAKAEQVKKVDGAIVEQFGQETFDNLNSSTEQIAAAFKQGLLLIDNDPTAANEFVNLARDFSNALYARLNSANLKPGIAMSALEEATGIMAPESLPDSGNSRVANAAKALNDGHRIAYS